MAESTLSRRISEFLGVALFALALIWLISLVTYEPTDPVWFFTTGALHPPANFVGRVGAFISELSFQLLGYAAYLVPGIIAWAGWYYFGCQPFEAIYTKLIGITLLAGCSSAFLSLVFGSADVSGKTFEAAGSIGAWLGAWFAEYLNRTGSIIVIFTLMVLSVILSTQFSFGRMFAHASQGSRDWSARGVGFVRGWFDDRRRQKQREEVIAKHTKKAAAARPAGKDAPKAKEPVDEPAAAAVVAKKRAAATIAPQLPLPDLEPSKTPRRQGAFTPPPLSLLDPAKAEQKIDERELMDSARHLEEKCREFAVEGQVAQIHPGPVVTTFEFKPEAGVKYSRITSLADDLCLAMQAESVLIDRIPGKSAVGIQVPNPNPEAISLREMLQSDAYERSTSKLTLALGKTIHGEPYVTDLATMPHLLIAGSTGTGKSVAINSMLSSILFRATPEEVRLIMIDPKRVELGMYEDIPHLMTPVVVDPKQAVNALRWAVKEMEERYKTLAAAGVRNIEQFNRNAAHAAKDPKAAEEGEVLQPLAYIAVVIDELADLMIVARSDVEESIGR